MLIKKRPNKKKIIVVKFWSALVDSIITIIRKRRIFVSEINLLFFWWVQNKIGWSKYTSIKEKKKEIKNGKEIFDQNKNCYVLGEKRFMKNENENYFQL